jgi:DNA-binding GntR family transcriptional regulator
LLDIDVGAPLPVERRTIYDPQERPSEVTETRYSPARYVFDIERVRDIASGSAYGA